MKVIPELCHVHKTIVTHEREVDYWKNKVITFVKKLVFNLPCIFQDKV